MSLVGTRPPTVDEWEKYELHHRARLAAKPGLVAKNEIHAVAVLIKDKFYHAECQRHIVQ